MDEHSLNEGDEQKQSAVQSNEPTEELNTAPQAEKIPPEQIPSSHEDIETINMGVSNGQEQVFTDLSQRKKFSLPRPENIFPSALRTRLGKSARPIASLLIIIVVAAAGFGVWHYGFSLSANNSPIARFKAKTVAFAIVSTVPSKDQKNVNPAAPITVTFNQPVDPEKLASSFFVSPTVAGKYTQSSDKDQVTFTPTTPFARGTKVQIMINGTFQSNQGSQLGADYFYGFTTSIPDNGVLFQDQTGLIDTLSNVASGQKATYKILAGAQVGAVNITLYKGTISELLNSLVYQDVTTSGYTSPQFLNQYVDTSGLTSISSKSNVVNNASYDFNQGDGIYLAVATNSSGKQLGYVWVDVSNFGVLLRQDDQKVVMDAQNYSDGADVNASVNLYNLKDGINVLSQQQVSGLTTVNMPLTPSLDLLTASYGGEVAVVPVSILNSQGDIRADKNLSIAKDFFALTDKPTYSTGDTVHLAGFVRQDNDAQYSIPAGSTIKMYVADPNGTDHLADFSTTVGNDGTFSVDIPTDSSWLTGGNNLNSYQIFAESSGSVNNLNPFQDISVASFNLTSQPQSASHITVSFSKTSYLPTQPIQATITATDANGKPLANANVDVHTFSKDYYENQPGQNYQSFSDTGAEVKGSPASITLDSNGQAKFSVPVSSLPSDGNSQEVTVQTNVHGQSGAGAAGGASTIVHQGNIMLVFGMGRTVVAPGGKLIGRVYAESLNGSPMANEAISYTLSNYDNASQSNTVIASGSTTSDGNGYAEIDVNIPSSITAGTSLTLTATASDSFNNKVQASNYYYIQDPSGAEDYSGAQLGELDVSGSSGYVKVGDTVNLTINAPQNMRVMMTMDRGRIYSPKMMSLNAGNNNLSFTVTKDMAPSFTITFGYFQNGTYHSEGTQFNVSEPLQNASVSLSGISQTVSANQPLSLKINTNDAQGNPLQSSLIVDVVDSGAYDLSDPVVAPMYDTFYSPRVLMTSSSSSLTNIGSGGGKCGGGGFAAPSFANALGTTLFWQPDVTTDASGTAVVSFTPPKGSWTVNVYSMDSNSIVGSATSSFTAN